MKKILSIFLSLITLFTMIIPFQVFADVTPVIEYTFDSDSEKYTKYGNAALVYDEIKDSKVLYLDGSNGTYAELPRGILDGKDKMTITMDVKSEMRSGNFFTFAYGRNSTFYSFFRMRGCEALFSTTKESYVNDNPSSALCVKTGMWVNVAIVIDDYCYTVYINGVEAFAFRPNDVKTGTKTSELGSNLITYLGKSFYGGDAYFKGSFDNFRVYDEVMTAEQVLDAVKDTAPLINSMIVGTTADGGSFGTDDHTASNTIIDTNTNIITPYVRKTADLKSIPVRIKPLSNECEILIDGEVFVNNEKYDLSSDKILSVTYKGRTVDYLLKTPQIANNAVLEGQYADPDIDYFDGKYWMYPTTDGFWWWRGSLVHAFSSEDLVNWKDEGVVLDVNNKSTPSKNENGVQIGISPWSQDCAWAPTVEKKNGKYYLYYCGELAPEYKDKYCQTDRLMAIGVAVADNPAGPFVPCDEPVCYDSLYRSKISGYTGEQIDPSIFTDDDGTSYILTGGSCVAAIAKLNDDMTSVDPSSICKLEGMDDFLESVYLVKRNGIYHFTWSCYGTNGQDYCVKYGVADTLTPDASKKVNVKTMYMLLDKNSDLGIVCTGHQCTLYQKDLDRCFIAYHRFCTPLEEYTIGYGFHRETCIDEVFFDENGYMLPLEATMEGTGPVTVKPASDLKVTISTTKYTYDGKAKKPAVTVKDSKGKAVDTSNYSVTYLNNTNAGIGTARVTFKNTYAGTVNLNFRIEPKITPSATSFVYSGRVQRPVIKIEGLSGSEYSMEMENSSKPGNYAVVINIKAPLSETVKISYTIKPRAVAPTVTSAVNGFTAKWSKISKSTGYQLQYSTKSDFSGATTVNVGSSKTVSKSVTGKKGGTKYYVRVRSYTKLSNGKCVYSDWSAKKTITTKVAKVNLKSVTAQSKAFTVKWAKISSITGYQIQYSTDKNFKKGNKTVTASSSATSKKVTKLSKSKTYYVRVRAYKKSGSTTTYGAWSTVKKIKTK